MIEQCSDGTYGWVRKKDRPLSIGRLTTFAGNAGVLLRAYIYARLLGREGRSQGGRRVVRDGLAQQPGGRGRVTGAVGQEHAVGLHRQDVFGRRGRRHHGDLAANACEQPQDVADASGVGEFRLREEAIVEAHAAAARRQRLVREHVGHFVDLHPAPLLPAARSSPSPGLPIAVWPARRRGALPACPSP